MRVKWIDDLKDLLTGEFLPHLVPVDPTLHWANPPGGIEGRDMRPTFNTTPGPYTGPVPIVTHLHGGHSTQESDGYAEAWYLAALLGIFDSDGEPESKLWEDEIIENPALGATEIWEIHNFTADAHPIHIHEDALASLNSD